MDMKSWRSTSNRLTAPLGRSFSEHRKFEALVRKDMVKPRSKMQTFFANLRLKLRKEKNKVFSCTAPPHTHEPYDSYNYSQNFDDEDSKWAEPENLSRSFSARFATTSSRIGF